MRVSSFFSVKPCFNTLLFCSILILAVLVYWSGLSNVVMRWGEQAEYSHGYLIPFVSLYILWEKQSEWWGDQSSSSWWGVALVFAALIFLIVGEVSALYVLIHYSFVTFLLGLSLIFLGHKTARIWVPIFLLTFAIPLPYILEVMLTAKLQLMSSSIGVWIIRLFDIPVYLSGNIIDLGEFKLHVVEACSGLRYLFPLVSVGVITAYFYSAVLWQRITVVATTIPISIFMNSFRIALTGVLADWYGTDVAEGFLHDFEGWVVFLLCLAILLLEIRVLELFSENRPLTKVFSACASDGSHAHQSRSNSIGSDRRVSAVGVAQKVTAIIMLVVSLGFILFVGNRDERPPEKISLVSFPMHIADWVGARESLDASIEKHLGLTEYVLANYRNSGGIINLYVAYYESQKKGVSPHSPKVCIPGGGWEITNFNRTVLQSMPVNRVVIQKGEERQLVYYWFVERGEIVANEYLKKWRLLRDALLKRRSDGALVRVVLPMDANADINEAEKNAEAFIMQVKSTLEEYLPGA